MKFWIKQQNIRMEKLHPMNLKRSLSVVEQRGSFTTDSPPATVAEMVEALRETQKFNDKHNFFNLTTGKVNSVLSKADKELKK